MAVGAVSAQLGNMGIAWLGRKDRQAEREQVERERHRAAQRENMTDLQDTLNEWAREEMSVHMAHAAAYRRDPTMRYGDVRVGDDLAERDSTRLRRLRVLVSRTEDDDACRMVDAVIAHMLEATGTNNADDSEAWRHFTKGLEALTLAIDRLGQLLRQVQVR